MKRLLIGLFTTIFSLSSMAAPFAVSNITVTGGTIDGTTVGATTRSTGAFTTLALTTQLSTLNGGTGVSGITNNGVVIGQGGAPIVTATGTTGQMLLGVTGSTPVFGNNPTITGGTIDNAVIGGTTKAAGSFTTVLATGTITPSSIAGIVGTATNDNANAGSFGEFVSAQGLAVSLTSSTTANITSISLTAGDWDVRGNVEFIPAGGTTFTQALSGANTVSATLPAAPSRSLGNYTTAAGQGQTLVVPTTRVSIASTTTVYLTAFASFSGSTLTASGFISARRIR